MTTSQQTILLLDQTREAGPNEHVQGVVTVQDIARLGSGDPTTGQNGSNSHPSETIPQAGPAHRPFPYPAWPTSKPGPQATSPLPGQHPHPLRTDQMVCECYDQERGMPCVSPPRPAVQKHRSRTYLPDARFQDMVAEAEAMERWLDDGGLSDQETTSEAGGVASLPFVRP